MDGILSSVVMEVGKKAVVNRALEAGATDTTLAVWFSIAVTVAWAVMALLVWKVFIYVFTKTARVLWGQFMCLVGTIAIVGALIFTFTFVYLRE